MYKSDILCIEHNSSRNLHELFAIENHFIILVSLTESRQMLHSICSSCERKKPEQDRYNNTNTRVTNLNTPLPPPSLSYTSTTFLYVLPSHSFSSPFLSHSPPPLYRSHSTRKKTHPFQKGHPSIPPPLPPLSFTCINITLEKQKQRKTKKWRSLSLSLSPLFFNFLSFLEMKVERGKEWQDTSSRWSLHFLSRKTSRAIT